PYMTLFRSRKYLTITTHKGMFCFNRLPFGITSAPSIFQKIMDQVLQGLPNVHCFLDDILVTGRNDAHHLDNLEAVLSRLEFFRDSLEQSFSKCGPWTTGGPPVPRNGPRRQKVNYCDISNIHLRTKRTQSVVAKSIKEMPNLLTRSE